MNNHDSDARALIHRYLQELAQGERPYSPHTMDVYRNVLVRWLRWYELLRGKRWLDELDRADVIAYAGFMRNPPADWIRPRRAKSQAEVPAFACALNDAEVVRNSRVIRGFLDYAVHQGWCERNVYRQYPPQAWAYPTSAPQTQYLDPVMWTAVWQTLDEWERAAAVDEEPMQRRQVARARWLCAVLYLPALRPEEVAVSRAGQLRMTRHGCWLHMPAGIGRGSRQALIPVPEAFAEAMARYRASMGIHPDIPRPGDMQPLVADLAGRRAITRRQCHTILKGVVHAGAARLERRAEHSRAEVLRRASGRWLRHTRAIHLLDAGADTPLVLQIMRLYSATNLAPYFRIDAVRTPSSIPEPKWRLPAEGCAMPYRGPDAVDDRDSEVTSVPTWRHDL